MRFFDLHCDTVTECRKQGKSLFQNDLHLDLSRADAPDKWAQVFAVWIPDDLRGDAAWAYFLDNAEFFETQAHACALPICGDADALCDALRCKRRAALFAVEGGAVLGGQLERLQTLRKRNVRLLTLTWNGENELAFGCQTPGGKLKPFGIEALREMDRLGILADVSHLHPDGFYDVLARTDRPVLATHSTSRAVLRAVRTDSEDALFSMRRALSDDQIRALAEHGGLIGLNFCGSFLGDPGQDGMQAALRHAEHILAIGGEHILAIGSDFDGCRIHPEMAGIEKMPSLRSFFRAHGWDDALCEKIFFQNALHFFKNVL